VARSSDPHGPIDSTATRIVEDHTVSTLEVELVAADRKVWEGQADMVVARTVDGELGILPGHTPLLGVLVEGEVRIKSGGGDKMAHVDSGFLSVDRDKVIIVAEAVDASQISA
jgi:F-type H+-transporting ATPase subunit epsilon